MRDSIGGSVTLVIIVVFIVIALGYMAFNVNYTKAFRMKDKIITIYNDYQGKCESKCKQEIKDYANQIGYSSGGNLKCPSDGEYSVEDGFKNVDNLYCIGKVPVFKDGTEGAISDLSNRAYYYKIVTKIDVQMPIINNVLNFRFFYLSGDTQTY